MNVAGTEALGDLAKELGASLKTMSPAERERFHRRKGPHRDFAWLETTVNGLRAAVFHDVGTNGSMLGIAVFTPNASVSSIVDPIVQGSTTLAHYQGTGKGGWCLDGGEPNPKLDRYIFVGCRDGVLYATPWASGASYGLQQIALLALSELAAHGERPWRPINDSEKKAAVASDRRIWWVAAGFFAWAILQELVI